MTPIISDDPNLEELFSRISRLVVENGGWIHPKVTIVSEGGELSVRSELARDSMEEIFRIPETCLPCLNDFEFGLDDDVLFIERRPAEISSIHGEILQLVIDIYNLSGKVASHRCVSPWFSLSGAPEVLEHLYGGRVGARKLGRLYGHYKAGDLKNLLLGSLFCTRQLGFKASTKKVSEPVLIPVVDCLNHHWMGGGFKVGKRAGEGINELSVVNSKPIYGSDECFVCYSKCDRLDSYLLFNFIDNSAPLVRSIPLQIALPNASIMYVYSQNLPTYVGKLPVDVENVRQYIPEYFGRNQKGFAVSHLLIPGEKEPAALRRTLEFVIGTACSGLVGDPLKGYVSMVERYVVQENIKYYEELSRKTDAVSLGTVAPDVIEGLRELARAQLCMLRAYKDINRC